MVFSAPIFSERKFHIRKFYRIPSVNVISYTIYERKSTKLIYFMQTFFFNIRMIYANALCGGIKPEYIHNSDLNCLVLIRCIHICQASLLLNTTGCGAGLNTNIFVADFEIVKLVYDQLILHVRKFNHNRKYRRHESVIRKFRLVQYRFGCTELKICIKLTRIFNSNHFQFSDLRKTDFYMKYRFFLPIAII